LKFHVNDTGVVGVEKLKGLEIWICEELAEHNGVVHIPFWICAEQEFEDPSMLSLDGREDHHPCGQKILGNCRVGLVLVD